MASNITEVEAHAALDFLAGRITHLAVHSAAPGEGGSNEIVASGRLAVSFAAASGRSKALAGTPYTWSVAATVPVTHIGFWSASSGGTYRGGFDVTDKVDSDPWQYQLTAGALSLPVAV